MVSVVKSLLLDWSCPTAFPLGIVSETGNTPVPNLHPSDQCLTLGHPNPIAYWDIVHTKWYAVAHPTRYMAYFTPVDQWITCRLVHSSYKSLLILPPETHQHLIRLRFPMMHVDPGLAEAAVFLVSFSQAHLLDDHAESLMRLAPLIECLSGKVGLNCLEISPTKMVIDGNRTFPRNGCFHGKIIYSRSIFPCHLWLPEGITTWFTAHISPWVKMTFQWCVCRTQIIPITWVSTCRVCSMFAKVPFSSSANCE